MLDGTKFLPAHVMLNMLADFLEKIVQKIFPDKFDMSYIAEGAVDGDVTCGSFACKLGWATAVPEFRARGLHITADGLVAVGGEDLSNEVCCNDMSIAEFFGISEDDTCELFFVWPEGTERNIPKAVKRLRTMAAKYKYKTAREVAR